ncbi:MAG: hypothetical protein CBC82_03820 [Cellvibrionales bacterium TMED122]|jgi:hypothetical protein|nr:MAG: hypothetical protein CBC82_03820 [Cellvibrionales bacterium TMED122]|tara:strand:- start:2263 stop:2481 length:219 start_codon:yes stop_codon:yes gene_type:complete
MNQPDIDNLIGVEEAAHILGFKQRKKVDSLIAEGYLKLQKKPLSKRKWLDRREVLNLPKPLPIPPPPEFFSK